MLEGLGKPVKILNLFSRTDITFTINFNEGMIYKKFKTIIAFTKSTDLVIRTTNVIKNLVRQYL